MERRSQRLSSKSQIVGASEADQVVNECRHLDAENVGLLTGMCYFFKLVPHALGLASVYFFQESLGTIGIYVCNRTGGVVLQTAFGFLPTLNNFIISMNVYGILEKIGISCSQSLGLNNPTLTKKLFFQAMVFFIMMWIFLMFPLMLLSKHYLRALGYSDEIVNSVYYLITTLFPSYFILNTSEMFITFCYSQGVESEMPIVVFINTVVTGIAVVLVCIYWKLGINGWIFCHYLYSSIYLVGSLIIYFTKIDRRAIGIPRLGYMFTGFCGFALDCFKYVVGMFIECSGIEIFRLLVSLTLVPAQVSANGAICNMFDYISVIGLGFSTVGRTRVNVLLSKKMPRAAKNVFMSFFAGTVLIGAVLGGLIYFGRGALLNVFAGDEVEIAYYLNRQLVVYSFCAASDLLLLMMFTMARSVNAIAINFVLTIVFLVCSQLAVGIFLLKYKPDSMWLQINTYSNFYTVFAILLAIFLWKDWREINYVDEERTGKEELELIYRREVKAFESE